MIRRPPRLTRTNTRVPDTRLFRAPVSLAQPEGAPRLVTSLRYPAVPVCTTLAIDRMGEMLFSVASMTASISRGTAKPPSAPLAPEKLFSSTDRKSVVSGKSVSVRVDLGVRRLIKKKKKQKIKTKKKK